MDGGLNMADMFGKIAEMQQKMAQTQENLAAKTVTAEAGGGMVRVTANGNQRITAIKIDPDVLAGDDQELLEDLVIAGVNKALEEASSMARDEMGKAAGGMLPPGILPPGLDLSKLGL
ncbi:MAG: YbaB/EbfC family nucleoid-associated protein [Bacteroidota bacterium]